MKGIQNPKEGVYTNVVESANATYERMKTIGVRSMPEAAFTVYNLHTASLVEVIRAYHGVGDSQIRKGFENLKQVPTAMPHFAVISNEELMQKMRESRGYQDKPEVNPELKIDPAAVEAEEIIRQSLWYTHEPENKIIFSHHLKAFTVAAYEQPMHVKSYTTSVNECSCKQGVPCVHWYAANTALGLTVDRDYVITAVKDRTKQQNRENTLKRKVNRAKKGYAPDGEKEPTTAAKRPKTPAEKDKYLARPPSARPKSRKTKKKNQFDTIMEGVLSKAKSTTSPKGPISEPDEDWWVLYEKTDLDGLKKLTKLAESKLPEDRATQFRTEMLKRTNSALQQAHREAGVEGPSQQTGNSDTMDGVHEALSVAFSTLPQDEKDRFMNHMRDWAAHLMQQMDEEEKNMSDVQEQKRLSAGTDRMEISLDDDEAMDFQFPPVGRTDTNFSSLTQINVQPFSDEAEPMDTQVSSIPTCDIGNLSSLDMVSSTAATTTKTPETQIDTQETSIEITTATAGELMKIQLGENCEGRHVTENMKKIAFIKSDLKGKAAIFHSSEADEYTKNKLKFIAAKVLSHRATYSADSKSYIVPVAMKAHKPHLLSDEIRRQENNSALNLRGKLVPIQLHCKCKHPDVEGIENNFNMTCQKGGEKFHSTCMNIFVPEEKNSYSCATCNLSSIHKGAVWAEQLNGKQIDNSCTVDNGLTALVLHKKGYNKNITNEFPKDLQHKALTKSLFALENGDSYNAQKTLHEYYEQAQKSVTSTKEYQKYQKEYEKIKTKNSAIVKANEKQKDPSKKKEQLPWPKKPCEVPYENYNFEHGLWGENKTLWSQTFAKGCTFKVDIKCNTCPFKTTHSFQEVSMYNIDEGDTISLFISKTVIAGYEGPCTQGTCNGRQTISKLQPDGKPWMLIFDLASLPEEKTAVANLHVTAGDLPKELEVAGSKYQLSHVLLNHNQQHYTSVNYDPKSKQWAYYDGKKDKIKTNSK